MAWKDEEIGQNADVDYLDFSDTLEKLLNKLETRCRSRLKCMWLGGLGVS